MDRLLTIGVQIANILTGITVFIMIVQLRNQGRDQDIQSLLYLQEYLSKDDLNRARYMIRTELCSKQYGQWSAPDKETANKICASYDQAGIIVTEGIVSKKAATLFLKSSWGESICDQYEALKPYLDEFQTPHKTGTEFFRHFAALYKSAATIHRHTQI